MNRKLWLALLPTIGFLWLINVSRPGIKVEGRFDDYNAPRGQESKFLRVASLNMLHGFPEFEFLTDRLEIIAGEITRLNADIVMLQEVPWTLKTGSAAEFLANKTSMNYAYLRANGNRWGIFFEEGEAILSRYPITNLEYKELQPKAGLFENRVVLHGKVVSPIGDIYLFVTHLTNGETEINLQQSQALLEFVNEIRGEYNLIAGDFNAQPESPQIQMITQDWIDPKETIPTYNEFTCCAIVFSQSPSDPYRKRIDYIFISNNLVIHDLVRAFDQPVEVEEGWLWPSDHAGLLIEFSLIPSVK
jgi:endonuclease/exonuclease/phosphatase family metal-dependent hydrolase